MIASEPNVQRARLPDSLRLCAKVPFWLGSSDLAQVDRMAREHGVERSTMIRRLVAAGLQGFPAMAKTRRKPEAERLDHLVHVLFRPADVREIDRLAAQVGPTTRPGPPGRRGYLMRDLIRRGLALQEAQRGQ